MGEVSSNPDPTPPPSTGESEATRVDSGREPPTQPRPIIPAQPPHQPTYVPSRQQGGEPPQQRTPDVAQQPEAGAPREPATIATPVQPPSGAVPPEPATQASPPEAATPAPRPEPATYPPPPQPAAAAAPPPPPASRVVRYGPGVPASQAGAAAESVWRTGRPPEPPPRQVRPRRVRRLLGLALTVILLVAAAVVLYLRFFHHPALGVSGVTITQQTKTGCMIDVTGRIDTNGAAGTVSYQWVYQPQIQAPQPLNVSVVAGQHQVYVTDSVQGQGHGTGSVRVTLDVLGPGTGTDSTMVNLSC
jgi:hypothetical protein